MLRKPSQRSINLYNRLIEQQNKVRKTLIHVHKKAEETIVAGRLPALIIPKSAHKIRNNQFQGLTGAELRRRLKRFWASLRTLREQFAQGLRTYLAHTVKDGYMQLWRDQIESFSGETPEALNGYVFTKDQIEDSDYGEFMHTYNRLFMMSPEVFLAMLYSGRLIAFKWIYLEMKNAGRDSFAGSWLQEQNDLLAVGPKDQAKLVESVIKNDLADEYKHSKRVEEKIERKEAKNEKTKVL